MNPSGTLYVTRIRANINEKVANNDGFMGGKVDPYVKVRLDKSREKRTKVIDNTGNPVWNNLNMNFRINANDRQASVHLFDKDTGSGDDILGDGNLPLDRGNWINGREVRVLVFDRKDKSKQVGEIFLTVSYKPDPPNATGMGGGIGYGVGGLSGSIPGMSKSGTLYVTRIRARINESVANNDGFLGGKVDPYVKVRLDKDREQRTGYIDDKANPIWDNLIMNFRINEKDQQASVHLFDKDTGSGDDILGDGNFPI